MWMYVWLYQYLGFYSRWRSHHLLTISDFDIIIFIVWKSSLLALFATSCQINSRSDITKCIGVVCIAFFVAFCITFTVKFTPLGLIIPSSFTFFSWFGAGRFWPQSMQDSEQSWYLYLVTYCDDLIVIVTPTRLRHFPFCGPDFTRDFQVFRSSRFANGWLLVNSRDQSFCVLYIA